MTEARPRAPTTMDAAGCPHATFRRAIARRNLTVARAVARELPMITLADALALTLLILERDRRRYTTAAMRWAVPGSRLRSRRLRRSRTDSASSLRSRRCRHAEARPRL
jgi:hypothetical protein